MTGPWNTANKGYKYYSKGFYLYRREGPSGRSRMRVRVTLYVGITHGAKTRHRLFQKAS